MLTPAAARERLIKAYAEMGELTNKLCTTKCKLVAFDSKGGHRCCGRIYCEEAKRYAKEVWNEEPLETGHPELIYMGPSGCTLAPHLRPLCTMQVCCELEIMGGNPEAGKRYFELRSKINKLEMRLDGQHVD